MLNLIYFAMGKSLKFKVLSLCFKCEISPIMQYQQAIGEIQNSKFKIQNSLALVSIEKYIYIINNLS
ncbi:MAG: hypothetical protein CFE24_13235 [Flavobacterium sp. BFFFF2]|nr:MAG: hypothetical protein CFE24_13235 [Flavobacterium sp. BFFFF2]